MTAADVETIASWDANAEPSEEIPFQPARVLMQDFTGVPAIVDLAAMRDAIDELGSDPAKINPLVPVDLVIDHSVQVDAFGNAARLRHQRRPRLRAQPRALRLPALGPAGVRQLPRRPAGDRDLPPGQPRVPEPGRLHPRARRRSAQAYPDTLVGTDSHTTMVNGLGVLGWGVGGIEAEAAMLGQPISMLLPAGGRLQARRRAARGRHRHRPGAHGHRDAARARRGLEVRRVLRPRPAHARARRPGDDRQHVAGVRLDLRDLPGRPRDAALPRVHRPPDRDDRARRRLRARAGDVPRRGLRGPDLLRAARARPLRASSPRSPARSARRTGSRSRTRSRRSSSRWPSSTPTPPQALGNSRDEAIEESFPGLRSAGRGPRRRRRQAARASSLRRRREPGGDRRARGEPGDGEARGRRARSSSTTAGS